MGQSSFVSNQGTQTPILTDDISGTQAGVVKIDISPAGAAGTLFTGTVGVSALPNVPGGTITNLTSGTINAATAVINSATISVLPNTPGGTLGLVTRVGNVGTLEVGTISAMPNIPGGSIVITTGTIVPHAITAATITAGTLTNLISGTINSATAVINSATISVLPNLPQGSITVTTGTIVSVGTIGTLGLGTVETLTTTVTSADSLSNNSVRTAANLAGNQVSNFVFPRIFNGSTWDRLRGDTTGLWTRNSPTPPLALNTYGTTTTGTIGTLIAAPSAGSAIVVTSLDISMQSGTAEPCVAWGLAQNGNQVLSRGNYTAGGGIAKTYNPGVSGSATGTALTFNILSGSGTISYNVAYFIAIP